MLRLLCAFALLSGSAVVRAEGGAGRVVTWEDDKLTIHVQNMILHELLEEISHQTGAELRGTLEPRTVTLDVDALPLDPALHRALGDQNFIVRYAPGGKPAVIQMLGGPEAKAAPSALLAAKGDAPAPERPALPQRLGFPKKFPSHRQLDLPEPLQKYAGVKTGTFDDAFDLATLESDSLARALASQVVLNQLERDRRVRRALMTAVTKFDDETLANFRGTIEGERVRELLEYVSVHSREQGLQHKATLALSRMTQ